MQFLIILGMDLLNRELIASNHEDIARKNT